MQNIPSILSFIKITLTEYMSTFTIRRSFLFLILLLITDIKASLTESYIAFMELLLVICFP